MRRLNGCDGHDERPGGWERHLAGASRSSGHFFYISFASSSRKVDRLIPLRCYARRLSREVGHSPDRRELRSTAREPFVVDRRKPLSDFGMLQYELIRITKIISNASPRSRLVLWPELQDNGASGVCGRKIKPSLAGLARVWPLMAACWNKRRLGKLLQVDFEADRGKKLF